jgi:hypothetical protein
VRSCFRECLRLYEREQFEHVSVGSRWETLPEFERRLHRYVRDRIIVQWEIDVLTPMPQVRERAYAEEQHCPQRQAQETWNAIQDLRPKRGTLGPEEVFAALWQRRVQVVLEEPDVARPGYRCLACSRLRLSGGACIECGGVLAAVPDVYEEAVHEGHRRMGVWRGHLGVGSASGRR